MSQRINYTAISPVGFKALGGAHMYVSQCGLPENLIELTYLRVSQINNCAYCLDVHTRALLARGETPKRLALVQAWEEAGSVFDVREKAAFAWAETVTRVSETGIPDEAYGAAHAVFDDKELVDLTLAISVMNAYNRLAIAFRRPVKPE